MSNFRTKLLGLAAMATAFVGMSYGQTITCVTGPQTNPTLRAEGQTELLGTMTTTCTNTGVAVATSGTVYIQTSLPITSKTFTPAGGVPTNEATLVVGAPCAGATCTVQGVVSGSQVSFALPPAALPAAGGVTLTITNIRVNASGGGAPQVTESGILSYSVTGPPVSSSNTAIAASVQGAGFILKTLGAASLVAGGTSTYSTCAGNPGTPTTAPSTSFTVNINELVSGAFLTQAPVAGSPSEQGQTVTPPSIGTAASGDVINVALANVPASATIYVPVSITVAGTTLAIANATPVASGPLTGLVGFTPSGGAITIPYTVTAGGVFGPQTFPVPVIMQFAANSAAAQTAVTAAVSYGPAAAALTGPATSIPTFLAGTPTTVNGSTITLCNTNLMFPFVTNQLGFDTGLVLANTTTDNLGTTTTPSTVKAQSGTCTLSFYGSGAPTPSTGVADPLGVLATATTHAFTVSSVAPGFQGYVIASCPIQYVHGYGFLAYNLTQNNGAVEGYIALVLSRGAGAAPAETPTF